MIANRSSSWEDYNRKQTYNRITFIPQTIPKFHSTADIITLCSSKVDTHVSIMQDKVCQYDAMTIFLCSDTTIQQPHIQKKRQTLLYCRLQATRRRRSSSCFKRKKIDSKLLMQIELSFIDA